MRRTHFLIRHPRLRKPIPQNRKECLAFLQKHIFLWRKQFGEHLLGIGFYDLFSPDESYRNIMMTVTVLVREHLPSGVAGYGQYLASGKYLDVNYRTEAEYLEPWTMLTKGYWLVDNILFSPLYKQKYIEKLRAKATTIHHPRSNYLIRASEAYREVQDVLPELLKEIYKPRDYSYISAYVNHLMYKVLVMLSFVNQCPFKGKNINDYAEEARSFVLQPLQYNEFANFHFQHVLHSSDLPRLQKTSSLLVEELGNLLKAEAEKLPEYKATKTLSWIPVRPKE